MKLYQKINRTYQAMINSEQNNNDTWAERHASTIEQIQREYFPHGSGMDSDCYLNLDKSKKDKLVITFEYHFMDDHGYYDGWACFDLIITPELSFGFDMKIKWYGYNNDRYRVQKYKPLLDEYLFDLWHCVLDTEIN